MPSKGFYARRASGRRWKRLTALALALLLLLWAWPYLKNLPRIVRLYREPPPVSLPMPVQGIEPSRITDSWGGVRSGGRRHEGTDILALRGTPVISTTHGVVIRKGWNLLGGRRVLVLGPAGWNHYYAHLDAWSDVGLGDWVEVGTVLGYVGDSGDAQGTPTHLHYGIYVGGAATDPFPLLTRTLTPIPSRPPSLGEGRKTKKGRARVRADSRGGEDRAGSAPSGPSLPRPLSPTALPPTGREGRKARRRKKEEA
jgi:murein DD-endopeptidase MepM/ murein hydrolase activator NlpD